MTQYRRARKEVTSITMPRVRHHSLTEIFSCVFQSVHQVQPPKCDCFTQFYSAKVAYKGFYHHWARKAGSCKRHKDISSENFSQKNLQNLTTTPRVIYRSFYVKSVKKKKKKLNSSHHNSISKQFNSCSRPLPEMREEVNERRRKE